MAKNHTAIEVTCPCCQSKLTVTRELSVVLSACGATQGRARRDIKRRPHASWRKQARKREDKFRDSWEAESKKETSFNPQVRGSP